ncbi:MAG: FAD-dependent oxidoreductase [Treponema sp.]|nr:FAD-dependent oxidoreductase [Treponema sp.]
MSPDVDLLVIGAGPAGLSAGQYGARAGLKTLVLEKTAPGGQALLIDRLENYPGWGAGGEALSGFDFIQNLQTQMADFGASLLNEEAVAIKKDGSLFRVTLAGGAEKTAAAVILATGALRRTLGVPGEARYTGRGVSYCATCDGPFFRRKKVFVIGGGDAACDEAWFLARLASKVVVVHRRDRFRAQRALAERVLCHPAIEVRFNTILREIKGDDDAVSSVVLERLPVTPTESEPLVYEDDGAAVFIFAGTEPQSGLAPDAAKDEAGYLRTGARMETSLPGLFAAGDLRAGAFRQVVTACADGAAAAHYAAAWIDAQRGAAYGAPA